MKQFIIVRLNVKTREKRYWCDFRPDANRMYFSWFPEEAKLYPSREAAQEDFAIARNDRHADEQVSCIEIENGSE